jgi:hypothetical protein
MPQIAIWVNKKTEAYLGNRSLDGESLAVTAGRLLKELAELREKIDKTNVPAPRPTSKREKKGVRG